MCRSTPQDKKACPISRDELKEVYNGLVKHVDKNRFTTDFFSGYKAMQTKMKDYQQKYNARRANILKEPFEMPDAPKVVESGIVMHGKKELQNLEIDLRFDQDDIDKYDELNGSVKAEFLNRCQSKEMCQNLLAWISLEMRFLHVCDALPTHAKKTLQQTDAIRHASALATGRTGDDDDGAPEDNGGGGGGEDDGEGGGGDVGGVPKSLQKSADIHNFLHWNIYNFDIPFKEMGYDAAGAAGAAAAATTQKKSFHAACILFFYSDKLTQMHSEVSNALHAAWQLQFRKVMQADDLKRPPLDYSEEEKNWCMATIDFLESQLTEDERVSRGLPLRRASARAAKAAAASAARVVESPPARNDEDDDDLGDARL